MHDMAHDTQQENSEKLSRLFTTLSTAFGEAAQTMPGPRHDRLARLAGAASAIASEKDPARQEERARVMLRSLVHAAGVLGGTREGDVITRQLRTTLGDIAQILRRAPSHA